MVVTLSEFLTALGAALAVVLVVIVVVHFVVLAMSRRWASARDLARHARTPFRLLLVVLALSSVASTMRLDLVDEAWWDGIRLALRLAAIGTGAWLLSSVLLFLEDLGLKRYRTDVRDNRTARRMRTQVLILRRLTVCVGRRGRAGRRAAQLPGRPRGRRQPARLGRPDQRRRRPGRPVHAGERLRRHPARVQRRDPARRRGDRRGGVGLDRGDHPELRGGPALGRPADGAAVDVLHQHAVPELDPAQLRAARRRRAGRRLARRRRRDAGRARRGSLERHRPVGRPDPGAPGDRRRRGRGPGPRCSSPPSTRGTLFDLRCHVREQLVSWVQRPTPPGLPRTRVELVEAHRRTSRSPTRTPTTGACSPATRAPRSAAPCSAVVRRRTSSRPRVGARPRSS